MPRELCHISDRSYPFLLANDMGIKRGPEMQSIACSGALRDDVYAYWMADGVDTGNYLGQNVPMFDNFTLGNGLKLDSIVSEPRLSNLNNRAELQQQARDSFTPGRVQQIELLKKYRPKVATIGISGNDMGFGDVLMACLVDIPGVECHYSTKEGKSELGRAIKANYGKQLKLYQTLKEASPVTDLYAVGYPQFVSDNSMYCWAQTGLSRAEQDMIRHSVIFANETIKQAALSAGIKYLNIENALEGGQVCQGGEYITTPLPKIVANFTTVKLQVEDASTMDSRSPLHDYIYQSAGQHYRKSAEAMANNPLTTIKVYLQETFHPNAIGHEQIYRYVKNLMNGTSLIDAQCDGYLIQCTTANGLGAAPELPTYFGVDTTDQRSVVIKNFVGITDVDSGKVKILDSNQTIQQGSRVKIGISDSENIPGDKVSIYIRSQKRLLGNAIVGENGSIAAEVIIPEDIPVGNHTLIVEPESNKGALYVQSVFVIGPEGDLDGDGVLDQQDTCQLIVPSGEDADGDGIDNACDLQLTSSSTVKFDTGNSNTRRISVDNSDNRGLSVGITGLGTSYEWSTSTVGISQGRVYGRALERDSLGDVRSKDVVGDNKSGGWDMIIVWGVMATLAITGVVAMISRIIKNKP